MYSRSANGDLRVLILASSDVYHSRITEALGTKQDLGEIVYADQDKINSSAIPWDIIILTVAQVDDVIAKVTDYQVTASLIVLYQPDEEARAFANPHPSIINILPLSGLRQLPSILEREHNLRRIDQALYRAIVEGQSDLICRYTPDFRLTFTNHAYSQQYDKLPDEIIGQNLFDMIPENDWKHALAHISTLTREQPVATSEHRTILPDGSTRWLQWRDRAIFDVEGNLIEYQGVGRDITETKAAQDRLNFLHALIMATSTANGLDDALTGSMQIICETQNWEYGEIWLPDQTKQTLEVGGPHFIHPERKAPLQAFWQATQDYRFKSGSGIPGRAWLSQAPSWTVDVQDLTQAEFLRLEHAIEAGIHGIVAIPIVDKGRVLAVMVFMALRQLKQDDDLLQLLHTALQQIAPIIRRQQITKELIASELKYRSLVDHFDGVITIADAQGTYLFGNEKAWEPFNLQPHEREGKTVYDFFEKELGDLFVERVRQVIHTGNPRVDTEGMQVGDEHRWLRSIIAPIRNLDGTITRVQTLSFDVTDEKRAEQSLQESEAQLRQAQKIAHLGSWTLDLKTNETTWSDEFFRICGIEPGSIQETVELGFSIIHPDDRDRAGEAVAASQLTGAPYYIEKRLIRPDGKLRWVVSQGQVSFDENGQPAKLVGTFLDITERKQAELALERTLKRLSALHAIDQSILYANTLETTAEAALKHIKSLVPCHRVSVVTIDVEEAVGNLIAIVSDCPATTVPAGKSYPMSRQDIDILVEDRYLLIKSLDQSSSKAANRLYEEGVRSILSIGLKREGQLIGSLNLHATTEDFFEGDNISVPVEVADQIAIAIQTKQLNDQIRRHNEELEDLVAQRTEELQLQQKQTEAILQSSSDGIVLLNAELQILTTNGSFCKLFDQERSNCPGQSLLEGIHTEDRDALQQQLTQTLADTVDRRCEVRAVQKKDQTVYLEVGISRVKQINGNPPTLVCVIRDITERKQAEEKLTESEERYRTTINTMAEGITMMTQDGTIQLTNDAAERILGLPRDQIMGRTSTDPRWRAVREDGSPFPGEEHPIMIALNTGHAQENVVMGVHRPDGTLAWVLINAQPIQRADEAKPYASVATFVDITERKRAEDALRQSETRYRALFEQSTDGVFILDLEGNHLASSQHAAEMLGYQPGEMSGFSFKQVTAPEEHAHGTQVLAQLLAGEHVPIYERRARRKDGTVFPVEISIELVRDDNGQPLHIQSLMRDITERKAIEQALRLSEEKFRQLIDAAPIAIVVTSQDGDIEIVNVMAEALFDYDRNEMIGQKVELLVPDAIKTAHKRLSHRPNCIPKAAQRIKHEFIRPTQGRQYF